MNRCLAAACAAVVLSFPGFAFAQAKATIAGVPDIPVTSVPNFLKLPPGENLGESVAVATNSKGNIYVYHRRDTTRLFEFDKNGNFTKEIGKGYYGFEFAHSVRVDKEDNIWTVDKSGGSARRITSVQGTTENPKFSPDGKLIAFSAQYAGNVDVYVVPAEGGEPKRLTWHPGADVVQGWMPDGKSIVFQSARATDAPTAAPRFWTVPVAARFRPTDDISHTE